MLCGKLFAESVVQIGDKTRLDAGKSFVTKGEASITKVEIDPGDGSGYVDVTGTNGPTDWYLDWVYSGISRSITATVRITTSGSPVVGDTQVISVLTATDDYLFSGDNDLIALEPDVMKWVPDGRSSWLNVHRAAQQKIMDYLNKMGVEDDAGLEFKKTDLLLIEEVRYWSRDWVLQLIFEGISNMPNDVFALKAKFYKDEASKDSSRAKIRIDENHDGVQAKYELINMTSRDLIRS